MNFSYFHHTTIFFFFFFQNCNPILNSLFKKNILWKSNTSSMTKLKHCKCIQDNLIRRVISNNNFRNICEWLKIRVCQRSVNSFVWYLYIVFKSLENIWNQLQLLAHVRFQLHHWAIIFKLSSGRTAIINKVWTIPNVCRWC